MGFSCKRNGESRDRKWRSLPPVGPLLGNRGTRRVAEPRSSLEDDVFVPRTIDDRHQRRAVRISLTNGCKRARASTERAAVSAIVNYQLGVVIDGLKSGR